MAALVIDADRNFSSTRRRQEVQMLSKRLAKQFGEASPWAAFIGASEDEKSQLQEAKSIINRWRTISTIEVFFEVCCQDQARKEFWIRYVKSIEDFRVVGSKIIESQLKNQERISDFYKQYFIKVGSITGQTAALVMKIKGKTFVEFSDVGALYVYNNISEKITDVFLTKKIENVSNLKDVDLPTLIQLDKRGNVVCYKEEGRTMHTGHWVGRLSMWMLKIMNISVDIPLTNGELKELILRRISQYGNNANLNDINVSHVKDFSKLFMGMKDFNGDVSKWDVSNATTMYRMFYDCENFDGNLSAWDVSNVISMGEMFQGCVFFNGDVTRWNVSKVTSMNGMFRDCGAFNRDLSKWDVSNVKTMNNMFNGCTLFRSDLSKWNVGNVRSMMFMFCRCLNFDSDLSSWKVKGDVMKDGMFDCCIEMKSLPYWRWLYD